MKTIPKELRDEFMKLVEAGDEAKARIFLTEHLSEFPQQVQENITMMFFEEALAKKDVDDKLLLNFKEESLKALHDIDRAQEELEKHAKLAQIKESL
jgi:hypothetical protein